MKKLICLIFGHKWTKGLVVANDEESFIPSRFMSVYCKRCGKVCKSFNGRNYKRQWK